MDIAKQNTIETYILPHLSSGRRGKAVKVELWRIVQAILYRLKSGCQWKMLPMREFFEDSYTWQSVYYHWRRWCDDGSWQSLWQALLSQHKRQIDLSNANIDGSHSISVKGGQAVGYQGRKKARTSNIISLSDSTGLPLALSQAQSGEHNDTYRIEYVIRELFAMLKKADIEVEGLFVNADASFDTTLMRRVCAEVGVELNVPINTRNSRDSERREYFDEQLYKKRSAIERSYAWMDSFRAVRLRHEVRKDYWRFLNVLACVCILIKRIAKNSY